MKNPRKTPKKTPKKKTYRPLELEFTLEELDRIKEFALWRFQRDGVMPTVEELIIEAIREWIRQERNSGA